MSPIRFAEGPHDLGHSYVVAGELTLPCGCLLRDALKTLPGVPHDLRAKLTSQLHHAAQKHACPAERSAP